MKTYPAIHDPGSIELLFKNIRAKGKPDKITTNYLATIGFRRQPDVKLLELLFFLGFIDNALSPTDKWGDIQNITDSKFKDILSPAISKAYEKVFQHQAEMKTKDSKVLMTFFKNETGVSDTESAYMVMTLQVLIDIAGFEEDSKSDGNNLTVPATKQEEIQSKSIKTKPDVTDEPAPGIGLPGGISLNITIPAEAMDAEMLGMIKKLLRKAL